MRYRKLLILLLTVSLMAVAGLLWKQEPVPEEIASSESFPLLVQVTANGETEEIDCWKDGEGKYYIFLPGYADLSQAKIILKTGMRVCINQQLLENGMPCSDFLLNIPYTLTYSTKNGDDCATLTFVQSAKVPTMYISVQSGSMDYIHAKKGNKESGTLRVYSADGEPLHRERIDSMNGRGNHTWNQPKKPYSLELVTEADLLGLGAAQNWVLMSNPSDPSHVRNKLVYDFADSVGLTYSPDCTWVDLYLNGEYAGLYLLSERNEIHPQRVALTSDSSFLVSLELEDRLATQGYPFITTGNGSALRIHHSSVTSSELKRIWQSAENAILAEDGIDQITGKHWSELIDMDSWARKYLIEEIFGNLDACAVSQYFYGDLETGKIYAGPVWDYDMSMGNSLAWQLSSPYAFFANRSLLRTGMEDPWFYALYQDEQFYDYVVMLYQTEFRPQLEMYLEENLDHDIMQISQAAKTDEIRWGTSDAFSEAEKIRTYLTQRMDFLTSVWLENETYYTVLMNMNEGSNTVCYAVRPGEYAPEAPPCDYRNDVVGWYYIGTDEPYDAARPINEDTEIYLKLSSLKEDPISPFQAVPIIVAIVISITVFLIDRSRRERTDKQKNERNNTSKISS